MLKTNIVDIVFYIVDIDISKTGFDVDIDDIDDIDFDIDTFLLVGCLRQTLSISYLILSISTFTCFAVDIDDIDTFSLVGSSC